MKKFEKHYIVTLLFLVIIFSLATASLTKVSTKVVKSLTRSTTNTPITPQNLEPFVPIMKDIPIVNYPEITTPAATSKAPTSVQIAATKTSPPNILSKMVRYIETQYTGEIALTPTFINIYGGIQRFTGKTVIEDADATKNVIKDNNDFLQFYEPYINTNVDLDTKRVATMKTILKTHSIPFLYVQPPTKIIEGYTQLPDDITDYTKLNVDNYLKGIHKYGVQYLDLRQSVTDDGLAPDTLFFKTDHHWTSETAFWAFTQTIDRLGELGVLDPNSLQEYTSLSNYTLTPYKNYFLGSQGRRTGKLYSGLDDYTLITPSFDTQYSVEINHLGEQTLKEGTFEETLLYPELLDPNAPSDTNRYATYLGQDHGEVIITNTNGSKNLLVIQNSYGLPYSSFLSTCFNKVHIIDLRFFDQCTFEEYLDLYDFDAVILLDDSLLR
ncbi:MAG: DHHW family protein [Cellulosilyticaceae bacterium]